MQLMRRNGAGICRARAASKARPNSPPPKGMFDPITKKRASSQQTSRKQDGKRRRAGVTKRGRMGRIHSARGCTPSRLHSRTGLRGSHAGGGVIRLQCLAG